MARSPAATAERGACRCRRRPAERRPPVRLQPVRQVRTARDDAARVDGPVHLVVVPLDVVEVDRVAEPRRLEQVPRVRPQHRQLGQLLPVALEVAVVDGVEPDQRGEQPDIRLGDRVTQEVPPVREPVREPVERAEQPLVRVVVRLLGRGEPAPVDPVVHLRIDPLHHPVHLGPDRRRPEVRRPVAVVGPPLEEQVPGDGREVVGDHLPARHVDHRRHGDPLVIAREAGEVGLLQPLDAEHRVTAAGVEVETPAALVVGRPADAHRQHVLQPEQPAHHHRPARPRAGPADHEPVAPRLDRVAVPAVGGDPGRDVAGVAGELALCFLGACHGPILPTCR